MLQADRPPDVDTPNAQGTTVRQLMERAMASGVSQAGAPALSTGPGPIAGHGPDPDIGPHLPGRAQQRRTAARGRGGGGGRSDDDEGRADDFEQRLREEMSDDEAGGIGFGRWEFWVGEGEC